jgi:hypothetical protein
MWQDFLTFISEVSQPHKSSATGPDFEKKDASSVNAQKSKKLPPASPFPPPQKKKD